VGRSKRRSASNRDGPAAEMAGSRHDARRHSIFGSIAASNFGAIDSGPGGP
jgi:hypothetical protein